MINQRRVRAVSRKMVFESGEGREALNLKKYCEDMPFWKSLMIGAFHGVVLYVLLLVVAILLFRDRFVALLEQMNNALLAFLFAISMAIFAIAYGLIADLIYKKRYETRKSSLSEYKAVVYRLERMKQEQDS